MTAEELCEKIVVALRDMDEVAVATPIGGEPYTIGVEASSGEEFFVTVEDA